MATRKKSRKTSATHVRGPNVPRVLRDDREENNEVHRPVLGSIEGYVWSLCDRFQKQRRRPPLREEAVPLAIKAGVTANSARLYVGSWRRFHGYTPGGSRKK